MNCKIALDILDLPNKNYTKTELKKAYYKKCLQHHPDKTKTNDSDMFNKCTEAYNYLNKRNNIPSLIHQTIIICPIVILSKTIWVLYQKNMDGTMIWLITYLS